MYVHVKNGNKREVYVNEKPWVYQGAQVIERERDRERQIEKDRKKEKRRKEKNLDVCICVCVYVCVCHGLYIKWMYCRMYCKVFYVCCTVSIAK